jgi:hypothetical protein
MLRLDVGVKLPRRSGKHNAIRGKIPLYTLSFMVILAGKSSSLLRPHSLPGIAVNKHLHERAGQPYADFEMRSASEYEFNTASGKA